MESPSTPMLWRVRGHFAGLEWRPEEGHYKASIAALPGCYAHGRTRTEALRRLARAIEAPCRPSLPLA